MSEAVCREYHYPGKIRVQIGTYLHKILNVLLHVFCFVLIVDPPNVIFKAKNIVFILLVGVLLIMNQKFAVKKFGIFLVTYLLLVVTFLRGALADYNFDYAYTTMYLKTFAPLLLLCWIDRIELFSKLLIPSICISLISLFIVCTMLYMPELETAIYGFMTSHDNFIMMANRSFLGYTFIHVFYRTIPLVIMPCSVFYYKFLFEDGHKKRNFLLFLILGLALFFSGTRANMLSLMFIVFFFFIMKSGTSLFGKLLSYLMMFIFFLLAVFVLLIFLSEDTENSNVVKFGHLSSYMELFADHWDILFFGQGIGGLFYTSGFHAYVPQTEWSYIEVIRYVGLFGGLFIFCIYFYPLYLLYKNRTVIKYAIPFGLGYLFYLGIAGTNPLLTSSTGMLALLVAYSYALSPFYRFNEEKEKVE